MNKKYNVLFLLIIVLATYGFCKESKANLSIGIAKTIITAPVGTDLSGFGYRTNPSIGVLDDIYTKAAIVSDGKTQIAFVTADILGFDSDDVKELKKQIKKQTGIKYVLFTASHTHSGPAVITLHGCGDVDSTYHSVFMKKIVATVVDANKRLTPVKLSYGIGYGDISLNRRNSFAKGTTYGVDSEIGILRFDKLDGTPVCIFVNYACHPVIMSSNNRDFTRDYPGVLQDDLEKKYNCQAMFLEGAAGDINPKKIGKKEIMQEYGLALSEEVQKTKLTPIENVSLKVDFFPVRFPIQELSLAEIDSCANTPISTNTTAQEKYHKAMLEWKESILHQPRKDYIEGEEVRFQIGDLVLVGVSGELFSHIGIEIKEMYKPKTTFVFGYTNGASGYLPTRRAFSEGGYEVNMSYRYYGKQGPFTPDLEDIILKTIKP